MTIFLRQSTASQEIPLGYFVDSTDGNTEETGLTIANTDIKVWKTGTTTLANKNSGGATHIANGLYYAVLDATDTDTIGPLRIFVHVSGALAVKVDCVVLDENVYDWMFGTASPTTGGAITVTSGRVNADITHIATAAVSTTTAQLGVNVVQISGDATAADNEEAFFDGTGYAGTGNTIPTVTSVTNMVTANVTQISGDATAADNLESYTDGTTPMPVNATQISGDATAADNFETMLDGTGGQTLSLKRLNVVNNAGDAVYLSAQGGAGKGLVVESTASAALLISSTADDGVYVTAPGVGINVVSSNNNAVVFSATAPSTDGLQVSGTDYGIRSIGDIAGASFESTLGAGKSILAAEDISLPSGDLDDQLQTIDNLIDTEVGAIKTKTDQLTFTVANQVDANALTGGGGLTAAQVRAAVGLASANLDTQLDALPTAAENAAEVISAAAADPIAANVKEVNDVALQGDGSATPWGPV
jgi:hypothetical protein